MIEILQNSKKEVANSIHSLFQLSYAVEAKLLNLKYFPPLKRPIESYQKSTSVFYGYLVEKERAGIIEISHSTTYTEINSLAVHPMFFRRGIGKGLIEFVFDSFDSKHFTVETAIKNIPATTLYKKLGFHEVKQWDTEIGIRKIQFIK
ncbi:GNAT family N-acetyltransferase [Arenibacter certesii]|uniref:N-acetyltransferase domain-containing protein n=1 Tax=Arenibacter certesii TaxID=228955 RepID=A0A918IXN0_9FLAO|nr:GNAT family N-acetyltransferase [Arenibacter certesii]GGW35666.1 hypothetical protein GCM10007383_20850 [Arenibacter certesii]